MHLSDRTAERKQPISMKTDKCWIFFFSLIFSGNISALRPPIFIAIFFRLLRMTGYENTREGCLWEAKKTASCISNKTYVKMTKILLCFYWWMFSHTSVNCYVHYLGFTSSSEFTILTSPVFRAIVEKFRLMFRRANICVGASFNLCLTIAILMQNNPTMNLTKMTWILLIKSLVFVPRDNGSFLLF